MEGRTLRSTKTDDVKNEDIAKELGLAVPGVFNNEENADDEHDAPTKTTIRTRKTRKDKGKKRNFGGKRPGAITKKSMKRTVKLNKDGTRRKKPGRAAIIEIRHLQKSTKLLFQRAPFVRLCRSIMDELNVDPTRFQASAFSALQEIGEAHIIGLFEDANVIRSQKTLQPRDFRVAVYLANKAARKARNR